MFDDLIEESLAPETDTPTPTTFDELYAARQAALPQKMAEIVTSPGYLPQDMNMRFSGAVDLDLVENTSIVVIGAGHIGSHLVKALVASGYKTIHVFDFDLVEPHNVGVQDHTLLDAYCKKSKVQALYDKMLEFRAVSITPHETKVTCLHEIKRAVPRIDALFVTVDNMELRNVLFNEIREGYRGIPPFWYIDIRVSLKQFTSLVLGSQCANDYSGAFFEKYKPYMFSDEEGLQEPCSARAIVDTGAAVAAYSCALLRYLNGNNLFDVDAQGFFDMGSDCPFKWTETFNTFEWRTLTRNHAKARELIRLKEIEAKAKNLVDAQLRRVYSREPVPFVASEYTEMTPIWNLCANLRHSKVLNVLSSVQSFCGGNVSVDMDVLSMLERNINYTHEGEYLLLCINGLLCTLFKDTSGKITSIFQNTRILLRDSLTGELARKEYDNYQGMGFSCGNHKGAPPEELMRAFEGQKQGQFFDDPLSFVLGAMHYLQKEGLVIYSEMLSKWFFEQFSNQEILQEVKSLRKVIYFAEEETGVDCAFFCKVKEVLLQADPDYSLTGEETPATKTEAETENEPGPETLPEHVTVVENTWCKFRHNHVMSGWAKVIATAHVWTIVETRGYLLSIFTDNIVLSVVGEPVSDAMEDNVRRVDIASVPNKAETPLSLATYISRFHA